MNELADERLVELAKQGQEPAFEQLIKRYHISLYKYIFNYTYDKQETEDLVQEVFIKMINNIEKYIKKINIKFSTWLFTIAHNTVIDYLRKKRSQNTISIEEESTFVIDKNSIEEIIIKNESIASIKQVMNSLSPEARSIIYLRYYVGFSYKEISKITEYSTDKVKWKLHDTIVRLRKLLESKEVKTYEK